VGVCFVCLCDLQNKQTDFHNGKTVNKVKEWSWWSIQTTKFHGKNVFACCLIVHDTMMCTLWFLGCHRSAGRWYNICRWCTWW